MKTVSTNSLHATITDENGMCAFCPTPISVRKDKQTEIVELGRKNIMFINDMEVDICHGRDWDWEERVDGSGGGATVPTRYSAAGTVHVGERGDRRLGL
jgi:hypothetical protein